MRFNAFYIVLPVVFILILMSSIFYNSDGLILRVWLQWLF